MLQDEYRFSVLMSVYYKENPEHFSEALASNLIKQTLRPDEVVLICDGELTDELDKVIDIYQKEFPSELKVYRLKKNEGLGKALNFGLEKCSYEWVARSDSDDICAENRFETQISFLKNDKIVDIVGSYIDEFENDYTKPSQKKLLPLEHKDIVKMAKRRNPINHMSVVFRKSAVIKAGSYIPLQYAEDYYLWVRAIMSGARFANIDQFLVHARIGNGMIKRRSNKAYIKSWNRLSLYMLENHMINYFEYFINMIGIILFIYMPLYLKEKIYGKFLRKK